MDNFIFSINATIPIFLVILLGWFLMKIHIITEEFANVANKYVFKVALPVLLFRDIATTSILDDLNLKFVLFCFFGTIIMFGLVWVFALIYCKDRTMIGAFVQGGARGSVWGLYEMDWLLFHLHGNQDGNRRGPSRTWDHAPISHCKYGQPRDPSVSCPDLCAPFWYRICLACGAGGMACKLSDLLYGSQKVVAG